MSNIHPDTITTAMCIWEYRADCPEDGPFSTKLEYYRGQNGIFETRERMAEAAQKIESAWLLIKEDTRTEFTEEFLGTPCWDFSVIPWVLEHLAKNNQLFGFTAEWLADEIIKQVKGL